MPSSSTDQLVTYRLLTDKACSALFCFSSFQFSLLSQLRPAIIGPLGSSAAYLYVCRHYVYGVMYSRQIKMPPWLLYSTILAEYQ